MTRFCSLSLRTLFAATTLLAAAACGSAVNVDHYAGTDVRTASADSLFAGVSHYSSGLTDSATYVVRTSAEWSALWARATSNLRPAPAVPAVDFTNNMVLVVAMGARSTGGYDVTIDRVSDTDAGGRIVESTFTRPLNCFVTEAFTAPFAGVLVPTSAAPVRFVNRSAEHRCS